MISNLEAIFVHLGTAKAKHLWANIKYLKSQWPEISITFITDSSIHEKKAKDLELNVWIYNPDKQIRDLLGNSLHNHTFRQGFWNYSILRLFAVMDYSISNPTKILVHLESDISIFPGFPFARLAESKRPGWFKFNENHDVGSIFVLPGFESAIWLREQFIFEISKNFALTDMTLLSVIARNHPQGISYLPVARNVDDSLIRESVRASLHATDLANEFDGYQGVFDSAPLGMWLLGQDPRNHLGRIIRYKNLPESFIQPQNANFRFSPKVAGPILHDGTPVFNLHVHSKELRYLDRNKSRSISQKIQESQTKMHSSRLSILALQYLAVDFVKRNGVFSIPRRLVDIVRGTF
jgi:hypothetical protein